MEAAIAAAAVVCRAVDAIVENISTGWIRIPTDVNEFQSENDNNNSASSTYPKSESFRNVFCCIRPPGHHAGRYGNTIGCSQNGFCLLNNAAIGAMYARIKHGLRRIAIIDIDAHFGNGTAEILEGDPNAFYASVHMKFEKPRYFFPSTECCTLGSDRNDSNCVLVNVHPYVRTKSRRGRSGFRNAISDKIIPALRTFKPDIIIMSTGFDGVSSDPIGGYLGLRSIDFLWATELIRKTAEDICHGRLVSVLEGGYDVEGPYDGLANCAEAHVLGLSGNDNLKKNVSKTKKS